MNINDITWINCPICDSCDTRCEMDSEDNKLIFCTNHACASNGGTNIQGLEFKTKSLMEDNKQNRDLSVELDLIKKSKERDNNEIIGLYKRIKELEIQNADFQRRIADRPVRLALMAAAKNADERNAALARCKKLKKQNNYQRLRSRLRATEHGLGKANARVAELQMALETAKKERNILKWESIESAPTDGSRFVAAKGSAVFVTHKSRHYVKWPHEEGGPTFRDVWNAEDRDSIYPWEPELWTPLPAIDAAARLARSQDLAENAKFNQ